MAERRFTFMAPEAQRIRIDSSPEQRVRPASAIRGSVQGGGAASPSPVRAQFDRSAVQADTSTIDALRAMGDAIIDPMVERKQKELFYEGARRQIEGEALQDVVESQPWYSKVFGPSASVQGARTMAQMQAVEGFTTQLQGDMNSLRQLSPDEFQQELFGRMDQAADLGDYTSNVAVQSQLIESMGPLVRSHTKEHLAYVQEQMQSQFTSSLTSQANAMRTSLVGLQNGTVSDEDYQTILANTESALHPIEGQTSESYWSGIESATEEAMAQGNFHFVNVVEQTLYDHMPVEQRTKFLADRRKYEIQATSDMAVGQFSVALSQLKAQSSEGMVSPQGTWDNINKLNARYRAASGIDRDLIDAKAAEGILTNNLKGIISEQKKATAAAQSRADKQNEIAMQAVAAKMAFMGGRADSYIAQGGDRQLTQDAAWGTLQQQRNLEAEGMLPAGTWAATAANASNSDGFRVTALENTIQRGVRMSIGEDFNANFQQSYQMWKELYMAPGGEEAAAAYAGDYAGKLEQYHNEVAALGDPVIAFNANFRDYPSRSPGSVATQKKVLSWVKENHTDPSVFSRMFGASAPVDDSTERLVASHMADSYAKMEDSLAGLSEAARMQRAWAVTRNKVDIVGGKGYTLPEGAAPIKDYLAVTSEEAGNIFDAVFDEKTRGVGVPDPKSFRITRLRDSGTNDNREAAFVVEVQDEDGIPATFTIQGSELRDRVGQSLPDPHVNGASPSNIPGVPLP